MFRAPGSFAHLALRAACAHATLSSALREYASLNPATNAPSPCRQGVSDLTYTARIAVAGSDAGSHVVRIRSDGLGLSSLRVDTLSSLPRSYWQWSDPVADLRQSAQQPVDR